MSVTPDAISVIIRCDAVQKRIAGGMAGLEATTGSRFRTDGEIAAASFMNDLDAILFSERLKALGLRPSKDMLSYDWHGNESAVRWLTVDRHGNYVLKKRGRIRGAQTIAL